jgi:hypothetical protein
MRALLLKVAITATVVLSLQIAASAQDVKDRVTPVADEDHAVVLEFGGELDWEPAEVGVHAGGTFALEVTPVENVLELEVGVAAVRTDGGVEMPLDILFKKPWRFSPKFKFMIGAGPEVVHSFGPDHGTFWGLEAVLDFMFWPRKNIGWYVEPGYEITFRDSAQHRSVGVSGGLLIGR